jgi:hypothetical protein
LTEPSRGATDQSQQALSLITQAQMVLLAIPLMVTVLAQRAKKDFPCRAYAPLLTARGFAPSAASALASIVIQRGTREENEGRRLPAVIDAIRFLSKPARQQAATFRKVELLLAAWEKTSIIETIFDEAHVSESEFINLLKSAATGAEFNSQRLTEIAAAIAPHLSVARGRRMSAASAAHEFLLEMLGRRIGPQAYTWNPIGEDYSDELTQATRLEFGHPRLSPKPAHRRLKRRRKASLDAK